jgi:hypothetical protein
MTSSFVLSLFVTRLRLFPCERVRSVSQNSFGFATTCYIRSPVSGIRTILDDIFVKLEIAKTNLEVGSVKQIGQAGLIHVRCL